MAPKRFWPVAGLYFGAPICAEYLAAYLTTTGQFWELLAGLLILGPLYGGAAILIREMAVRTGRGWIGILLLAAAFGILMPGLIDLTLWMERSTDVPYLEELRGATLIPSLGFAFHPLIAWTLGHVVYSIGAPLAMLNALAPRHLGRPLLGWKGISLVAILWLTAAALVHADMARHGRPSAWQAAGVLLAAGLLVMAAFSRVGLPLATKPRDGWWTPWRTFIAAFICAFTADLLPWTWTGTVILAVLLVAVGLGMWHAAKARSWNLRHTTALATGALVSRCAIGFLSPLPPGVNPLSKYLQNAILLLIVLLAVQLAWRKARRFSNDSSPTPPAE